jgi:nicotinamide-nucleotide amidase
MTDEAAIGELLRAQGWTLATAESLTGGRVGQLVTSVAGASDYYIGGIISYATAAKAKPLGVDPDLLYRYGPVSREVATAMAMATRKLFSASVGLSTTGVAGPTEQDGNPVGTLYLGISDSSGNAHLGLRGDVVGRNEMQAWAAREAVSFLLKKLRQDACTSRKGRNGPS